MKILVINAGSSSLKYQLINMEDESVLAKGNCERIGTDGKISHKTASGKEISYDVAFPTHKEAFMELVKNLVSGEGKVIDDVKEISAVGHRVLHGSEKYKTSTLITDTVIEDIFAFSELGPLHNPPQATAMRACRKCLGKKYPWWLSLTPLSIRQCRKKLIFLEFLTSTMKNTTFAVMDSTVPVTGM